MKTHSSILAVVTLAVLSASATAQAQFPDKPIRVIVTNSPGDAPDVAARLLGERLTAKLGQPIVVENRTGANGNIGGDAVAKAAPDGYTLLLVPDSVITINPHVYAKSPFNTLKDLVPITSILQNQFALTVHPSVPAKTLPEFVAHARTADPPLRYASPGLGSLHQLGIEMLKQRAGINLAHVPYRGGAPAGRATVAGETHVVLAGAGAAGLIQSSKLRALALTGAKRSALFPDLVPIADFYPGYDLTAWAGLFAPAGTPEPIVTKLRDEIQKVLSEPEFAQKLVKSGPEPLLLSAQEFDARIRRDFARYGEVVKAIGLTIE